jgi:hypothetical protein
MASAASKKLLKELPSDEEMRKILSEIMFKSDEAVPLLAMAYLEHELEILLRLQLRPLSSGDDSRMFDSGGGAILDGVSTKIRVAYAIRAIDKPEYLDLLLMNDIRNVFSHSLHSVDFENPLIVTDCNKLTLWGAAKGLGKLPTHMATSKNIFCSNAWEISALLRQHIRRHKLAAALLHA